MLLQYKVILVLFIRSGSSRKFFLEVFYIKDKSNDYLYGYFQYYFIIKNINKLVIR